MGGHYHEGEVAALHKILSVYGTWHETLFLVVSSVLRAFLKVEMTHDA